MEANQLSALDRAEVFRLCNEAYGEDVSHLFAACTADAHALARAGRALVGHGMIVTRWLQVGDGPLLREANVEPVATAAGYRKQGIGAGIMRSLAEKAAGGGYNPAALCPADAGLYGHLGWEYWPGPLFIRPGRDPATGSTALIPSPEERVMIPRLHRTPPLDLTKPLSGNGFREGNCGERAGSVGVWERPEEKLLSH